MSEVPIHSRALYSPADEHSPPRRSLQQERAGSITTASSRRSRSSTKTGVAARFRRAKARIRRLQRWARKRLRSMTLGQKIVGGLALTVSATIALLTLIFHEQILHAMLPVAAQLRDWKAGWLVIFLLCFVSAFPPMVGYSTSVTAAGFVYGFPHGWFIVAAGTIIGSTCAFILCRYFFHSFAARMVATDRRFAALSLTLKHDGLKLLCMIRLCPLPYSISNGAISTFPTVSPGAFMFATAVAAPKLLIHVWIGHRLAVLAAAEMKMDTRTKAMNYGSIGGGLLLGAATGLLIYKRTIKRVKQLEIEERTRLRCDTGTTTDDDDSALESGGSTTAASVAAAVTVGLLEGDVLGSSDEDDEGAGGPRTVLMVSDDSDDSDEEGSKGTNIGMVRQFGSSSSILRGTKSLI